MMGFMNNWNLFVIMSTFIIMIALFASGKINFTNMLNDLNMQETFFVALKTLVVSIAGVILLLMMILLLLIDVLVSLITSSEFPILHFLYNTVYIDYFRNLYWDTHSGSHLFMACILLFGIAIIYSYIGPFNKKRNFIFHKSGKTNTSTP
jgi:hypothetical protein